jgi:hypothetical protein
VSPWQVLPAEQQTLESSQICCADPQQTSSAAGPLLSKKQLWPPAQQTLLSLQNELVAQHISSPALALVSRKHSCPLAQQPGATLPLVWVVHAPPESLQARVSELQQKSSAALPLVSLKHCWPFGQQKPESPQPRAWLQQVPPTQVSPNAQQSPLHMLF